MTEDKKEPWLNYLALTTVILAVCATLATFKGGGYSTRAVMSQAQASDEWAFFQAKGVKEDLFQMNRAQVALERKALGASLPKAVGEAFEARVAEDDKKVAKYEAEKTEIMNQAKQLEKKRDDAQKHGGFFGIAVIFLQISILLSSIAALLKHKQVWMLGLVVGAGGIFYFLKGFFLFL